MTSGTRPPRLGALLLRLLLRGEGSEFIAGDIEEAYRTRISRERGPLAARLWFWRQALGAIGVRAWRRVRRGGGRSGEGAVPRPSRGNGLMGGGGQMMQDLSYAVRSLRARPWFAVLVVLTIGLGIGATTTTFSVVNAVLIEPLPYEDPGELVTVWEHNLPRDRAENVVGPASYLAWREEADVFRELAAVVATSGTVTGGGEPERVGLVVANATFFPMMGVRAVVGRVFSPEEDAPDVDVQPAVLGYGFWQRRYGGDPGIVGRTITLNGGDAVVVGVLPADFRFEPAARFNYTGAADVWIPHGFPESARNASGRYLQVMGRLEPGVSVERADAQIKTIAARLSEARPDIHGGWSADVVSLRDQVVGDTSTTLLIVLGAVGFVLLIACANVANLLLIRGTTRTRELAVRSALGASRGRVLRQLLTESGALALAGGVVGLALAHAGVRAIVALGPQIPRIEGIAVDGRVLAFVAAVSVLTGLLFGLAPALRGTAIDLVDALKEGSGGAGAGRGSRRARAGLVVVEIALSLVLLVGAGLLLRSFAQLMEQGAGFPTERLLAASVELPRREYREEATQARFFAELVQRVQALPGIEAASAGTAPPLTGPGTGTSFYVDDRPVPEQEDRPVADIRWVALDYFRTMGIPLLEGRTFDERDTRGAPLRIVINQTMAERFWPDGSPIGKTISMPWDDVRQGHVIGVVGDIRHYGPDVPPRSMIYWHQRQFQAFQFMTLVVRTPGEPAAIVPALRDAVHQLDPDLPLYGVRTMDAYLRDAVAETRFAMFTLGAFAVLALLLAAIGIYGVIAYAVRQRTHEMGIRMALGAGRRDVVLMVIRSGAAMLGLAVAIGLAAALLLARFMEGMLFGIDPSDPITLAAVSAVLALVTLVACYIPARRASRVDPLSALRYE